MQHIFEIHDYDEHFLEQFTSQSIPIYDLWSIRPLQNEQRELISGTSEETDKFRSFINEHAGKDFPHPLVIVIGNAEKSNPNNMSNTTKRYFKLKFEKFKGNDLGTPLPFNYPQNYPTGKEQMMPLSFSGHGQKQQQIAGMQGVSYTDIQGIVDRNVSDATRSIRAEYEESSAKREADSIKRIAELEMKMEFYKLEMKAKELEKREEKLEKELEGFAQEKVEGLGTVKEYTKTIAGGLIEVGKTAFGLEDSKYEKQKQEKKSERKEENLKGNVETTDFEDEGFVEKETQGKQFDNLIETINNLSEDQKYDLLDVLMPEEVKEIKEDEIQTKKTEDNEEIPSDNND